VRNNNALRIHVINVGHGDSILVEFPDDTENGRRPRFGLVDAGGEDAAVRTKTFDYLQTFLEYRLEGLPSTAQNDPNATDYRFEFICLTHPHSDHLFGMMPVLEGFCGDTVPEAMKPKQFWDCGFRYNSTRYLQVLRFLRDHPQDIQFMRIAAGTEFHYDDAEVLTLAPSIDMRNRYDTYGVEVNDASIVLKISLGEGIAILTGDAQFDTWGKVCEEFPRVRHVMYPTDSEGNLDKRDPNAEDIAFLNHANQLNCQLLKVSHHGSKRGTSFEYVEKLSPAYYAITCDRNTQYQSNWRNKFPHAITRLIIGEESDVFDDGTTRVPSVTALSSRTSTTAQRGTLVYRITRGRTVTPHFLREGKHERVTVTRLVNNL